MHVVNYKVQKKLALEQTSIIPGNYHETDESLEFHHLFADDLLSMFRGKPES